MKLMFKDIYFSEQDLKTLTNLKILLFRNRHNIDQSESYLRADKDYPNDCGCFGTFISKFFDIRMKKGTCSGSDEMDFYYYADGKDAFKRQFAKNNWIKEFQLEDILHHFGAHKEPFGGEDWDKKPHIVLKNLIKAYNKEKAKSSLPENVDELDKKTRLSHLKHTLKSDKTNHNNK